MKYLYFLFSYLVHNCLCRQSTNIVPQEFLWNFVCRILSQQIHLFINKTNKTIMTKCTYNSSECKKDKSQYQKGKKYKILHCSLIQITRTNKQFYRYSRTMFGFLSDVYYLFLFIPYLSKSDCGPNTLTSNQIFFFPILGVINQQKGYETSGQSCSFNSECQAKERLVPVS